MITVPQLDPVSQIRATDVIMITHADGTTEKITGENFMKAMAVDVIAENNMNSVTSNAVAKAILPNVIEVDCSIKGKIRLLKIGNLVIAQYLELDNATFNPTTEAHWVQIATIPKEYKPKYAVYFLDEGSNLNIGRYQIYANNTAILFYRFGGQNYGWETAFNVMWITN